jgi:hypothetical protein
MAETHLNAILAKMKELSPCPDRVRGAETEVYYDAGLRGEDAWELIRFLVEQFRTDFSAMNVGDYVPHEGGDLRTWLVPFGRRPFKSLTAGRLARAADIMEWIEER